MPAVLVAHGHWKHGRVEHLPEYSVPALAANLAAQGYVVLAYDMVGYNDTRQLPHKFGGSDEERAWSFHPLGVQLWNSIRAMDVLAAHPLVDASRIGVTGASGGGTQTLLLTAVDDRVRVSIPAAMVSATFQGDDDCEVAPGLRIGASNLEIAALAAPRPQLLLAASGDWTKHTPELEYPAVRTIYQLYGSAASVNYAYVDSGHNYNRESRQAAYDFLWRHLALQSGTAPREDVEFHFPPESLLIGSQMDRLTEGVDRKMIFGQWRDRIRQARRRISTAARKELLQGALALIWPRETKAVEVNGAYVLDYGGGERVPARWVPSGPARTLVVHEKGMEEAERSPMTQDALRRGDSLLLVNLFSFGHLFHHRHGDYLTFHRSDDANRIQDILTALSFLSRGDGTVTMSCQGLAALWCSVAAAAAPVESKLELRGAEHLDKAKEFYARIPGFHYAGVDEAVETAVRQTRQER